MTDVLASARIALAGNPNCGKTALFNALTGSRQKVANYPGVTVERKEGFAVTPSGRTVRILDIPGAYSLDPRTPDEAVARDVLLGRLEGEAVPCAVVAVADATNLERSLGFVLELRKIGRPVVLALNMVDLAKSRGMDLDFGALSRELSVPVVPTVATRGEGIRELLTEVDGLFGGVLGSPSSLPNSEVVVDDVRARFQEVDRILSVAVRNKSRPAEWSERIDRVLLHRVWGTLFFALILIAVFQAIFVLAAVPQDWIRDGFSAIATFIGGILPEGPLRSLLVDGVIAGVGAVVVFLPQILLLFFFVLLLEDSGYMARAAFLMDRVMGSVGLHGKAFLPLLSSHACAIPGIMSARTIENRRDRIATILVAPLTTCSARLPVYSLLIGAFIADRTVWGPFRTQGLTLFVLYLLGLGAALVMAGLLRRTVLRGPNPSLLFDLPTYKWPSWRNIVIGLFERGRIFARRAGTVILALSIAVWFLVSYPKPDVSAVASGEPAIAFSYAGSVGRAIEPVLRPLGFNWQIGVALIPGFAAREVMVSALGTVYAVEQKGDADSADGSVLGGALAKQWSLATALSLLAWYVFSCQCLSTLAVARRETNSWRWPMAMFLYMTVLAYVGSFLTYRMAIWLGWG